MAIELTINSRNLQVTDKLRDYIESRAQKLDRYLPDLTHAQVDLRAQETMRSAGDRQVAQITLPVKGSVLRAEERSGDIQSAFDKALDKIQRQIERFKGKGRKNRKKAGQITLADILPFDDDDHLDMPETGPLTPAIGRRKAFPVTPMDELEALEQMQLSGHDNFYMFLNADTNKINLLYTRKDGSFGLLDPTID